MFERNAAEAPERERKGLVSRVLLQEGDASGVGLEARRVEGFPGSRQRLRGQAAERICIVSEGTRVGDEKREMWRGDPIHAPSGAARGIEDASGGAFVRVSASALSAEVTDACDVGQAGSRDEYGKEAR